jgi:hypothetical protein
MHHRFGINTYMGLVSLMSAKPRQSRLAMTILDARVSTRFDQQPNHRFITVFGNGHQL